MCWEGDEAHLVTDRSGGGSLAGMVLAAGGGAGQVGELMSTRPIALPTDSLNQRAPSAPRVMPQGPENAAIMLLTDFAQYWLHRAFHRVPALCQKSRESDERFRERRTAGTPDQNDPGETRGEGRRHGRD